MLKRSALVFIVFLFLIALISFWRLGQRSVKFLPWLENPGKTEAVGESNQGRYVYPVRISDTTILVEIADNSEARTKGLSGRKSLGDQEGMLFVFDEPGRYGFWMKDMNFPLDIIWIRDGKAAGFEENIQPASFPITYFPPETVDMVLEINAGKAANLGVKIGDMVLLK